MIDDVDVGGLNPGTAYYKEHFPHLFLLKIVLMSENTVKRC